MILTKHQLIHIHPDGHPQLATTGTVLLVSANGESIALNLRDCPWTHLAGLAIVETSAVLLASKEPDDRWRDVFSGRHFRITPAH